MIALMALCASAAIGDIFSVGNLSYVVLDDGTSTTNPAVGVTGLSDAAKKEASLGTLFIYGSITYGGKPYHVTHIQDYAFENTTNISTVKIKYGVYHSYFYSGLHPIH
ncbi:MAG: hypothetical protein ACI30R_03660 [Sodaliphilus sp.]